MSSLSPLSSVHFLVTIQKLMTNVLMFD
jgi:hypothetical protein